MIIPKPMLQEIGASAGDQMEWRWSAEKSCSAPVKPHPRDGWAKTARLWRRRAKELVWPEFGNIDDEKLTW